MTLSITTLNVTAFSIMIIMTFGITTLSIMALRTIVPRSIKYSQHNDI